MNSKNVTILAIVGVVVAVIIYAATAKETTTGGGSSSSTETGGVGDTVLSAACKIFGINC